MLELQDDPSPQFLWSSLKNLKDTTCFSACFLCDFLIYEYEYSHLFLNSLKDGDTSGIAYRISHTSEISVHPQR